MNTDTTTTKSIASDADTVEVGEITVQYTAHGADAEEEMAEFCRNLRAAVSGLDDANAVVEMFSLPEIDARLSWNQVRERADVEDGR